MRFYGVVLQDGDVIPLGGNESLHVMHTPGHSPDSITLWDPAVRLSASRFKCTITFGFLSTVRVAVVTVVRSAGATAVCRRLFVPPCRLGRHHVAPRRSVRCAARRGLVCIPERRPEGKRPCAFEHPLTGLPLTAHDLHPGVQLHSFIESESGNGQSDITLACGHNSFSLDAAFVGSVIKLFSGIRDGVLEPRDVVLWGMDVWEYVCPSDTRASVVVRSSSACAFAFYTS